MPRRPSFRRDTDLQREIRRINRNVQNKKSRIRVDLGLEVIGTETVKFKEFSSRREINSYIKKMSKFLDRKADPTLTNLKGAELKRSVVKQAKKEIDRINKLKMEERQKYENEPFLDRGKPTGLTIAERGLFGDNRYSELKPLKFNPHRFRDNKELKEWLGLKKKIYKGDFIARKNELYRQNYMTALTNVFGKSATKELRREIENMELDEFTKKYYQENLADINFIYDFQEAMVKLNTIKDLFNGVYG